MADGSENGNKGRSENGNEDRQSTVRRFLDWVNADYDGINEEDEHEDHEDHHEEEHEEEIEDEEEDEDEEVLVAEIDETLEDYEDDDEFEYPDEIIAQDDYSDEDEEIDYADTAPAYQETMYMTKRQKMRMRRFRVFYLALSATVALNVIVVLLLTVHYSPPFGAVDSPTVNEVYLRYVVYGVEETGALNLVAAVLYAYRSFDTLGEALVLFTAAIGVIMLMRETRREETE